MRFKVLKVPVGSAARGANAVGGPLNVRVELRRGETEAVEFVAVVEFLNHTKIPCLNSCSMRARAVSKCFGSFSMPMNLRPVRMQAIPVVPLPM